MIPNIEVKSTNTKYSNFLNYILLQLHSLVI